MFTELLDKLTMAALKTMGLSLGYADAKGGNVDSMSSPCSYCEGGCGGSCEGGCAGSCYGSCWDSCAGTSSN